MREAADFAGGRARTLALQVRFLRCLLLVWILRWIRRQPRRGGLVGVPARRIVIASASNVTCTCPLPCRMLRVDGVVDHGLVVKPQPVPIPRRGRRSPPTSSRPPPSLRPPRRPRRRLRGGAPSSASSPFLTGPYDHGHGRRPGPPLLVVPIGESLIARSRGPEHWCGSGHGCGSGRGCETAWAPAPPLRRRARAQPPRSALRLGSSSSGSSSS